MSMSLGTHSPNPEYDADKSFEHFYREHHQWLVGWIRSRLNCPEQSRELAQDAFIDVLVKQHASSLNKPRAYLSRVARNRIIDLFRRRSIEKVYLEILALQPEAVAISPEDRHCIVETLLEVDRLLDQLGERGRTIFLMAQIDGLSYVEIGRRLNVSTNTVRKHFIRAMAQCLMLVED